MRSRGLIERKISEGRKEAVALLRMGVDFDQQCETNYELMMND